MRIRKRKVPFPLSALSPGTLSDPHFNRSSIEQRLQVLFGNSHSSVQPNHPIGDQDCPDSALRKQEEKKVLSKEKEDQKDGGEGEKRSTNNTRLCAKTPTMVFQESTSVYEVDGRYCETEKSSFSFKNKRESFERKLLDIEEKDKKMKTKMKIKMNKKCMQVNGNQEKEDSNEESHEDHNNYNKETNYKEGGVDHRSRGSSSSVKKRVRGGAVLMEGSRCSRVNGRGWRCCQQTLVGYSLCEHHLGKGRLRSMTNVPSRSIATTAPNKGGALLQPLSSPSLSLAERETVLKNISLDDKIVASTIHGSKEEEEEMKPSMTGKKKQKLGMVKARTISSLLSEANNAIVEVSENEL